MAGDAFDPVQLLRPRRRITGMSAILLPFDAGGAVDWPAFRAHVARPAAAGLTPAVNMDTGYVHLLDDDTIRRVLDETKAMLSGGPFVAGVFIADHPGDHFNRDAYLSRGEAITSRGGT